MARKQAETRDDQVNRVFEKQQRRLNRRRFLNAVSAIFLLVLAFVVLQFTPYRNIHLDIFEAAKDFVKSFVSESAPVERDPRYW